MILPRTPYNCRHHKVININLSPMPFKPVKWPKNLSMTPNACFNREVWYTFWFSFASIYKCQVSIFADRDIKIYKVWNCWQSEILRKMNKILPLLNIIDSRNDEIRDEVIKRIDQGSVDQYQIVSTKIFRPRTRSMDPWLWYKRKGSRTVSRSVHGLSRFG